MKEGPQLLETYLEQLKKELKEFTDFFEQGYDYNIMIYALWDAKDILGHITFWHESFARNLADLANERTPNPLKGKLSEVNKLSVESTKAVPIPELIIRLQQAQNTVEQYIYDEGIELIPYKKGSRDYSRSEHLQIVTNHIRKHLNDLNKQYGKTKNQIGIT
ncbi:hypothetical protein [Peijinzhouia sedimentorum]